jgi:penicillin-binding protein 1A
MTLLRDDAPTGYCTRHSPSAVVTVCKDSPVLNAEGVATGLYHLAGEYCPEESRMTVNALDYARQAVGSAVAADEQYTLGHAQAQGACTVHTTPPVTQPEFPELIDPDDPNWPGNFTNPDLPEDPEAPADPEDQLPGDEPFIPA